MFIVASVGSPLYWDFSGGASGKEPACQCGDLRDAGSKKKKKKKRCGFNPWVRKIHWRRKWQLTPLFLPGKIPGTEEPSGLQSTGSQRVAHD